MLVMSIFYIAGFFSPIAKGKIGHGANLLKTWKKLSEVTAGTTYVTVYFKEILKGEFKAGGMFDNSYFDNLF
jgi:hypothetical protein